MTQITIFRCKQTSWGIEGMLHINDEYICDTIENKDIHLKAGLYDLPWPKESRDGLPGRGNNLIFPFIHSNGVIGLKSGEVAIGVKEDTIPAFVLDTRSKYRSLYCRLQRAYNRKQKVTLRIVNEPNKK